MSTPSDRPQIVVDVVSDVVCPWCFVGKRRLEKALARRPDLAVTVRWNPFFLNPWIPRDGIDREQYLTTKFGSADRYKSIAQRLVGTAAEEGLVYNPDKIVRQPNTLDCHRLILWAGASGNAGAMKQRLMDLYFTEGADLTDREVLVRAATDCGLDAAATRARLASDEDIDAVTRQAQRASDAGIDGVPCFIFDGEFAVSGAQSAEYLAEAMDRAARQRRSGATAASG